MITEIYKIDSNSIYIDVYLACLEEDTYYNGSEWLKIDFDYVEVHPPNAEVVKWGIDEWVVVEEYPPQSQYPQIPTTEERLRIAEDTLLDLMTTIDTMLGGEDIE